MTGELKPGLTHELSFPIDATKIVPALYPEASEFQQMPQVFATGFMVGFIEWACIQAINPYIDWPREQTVGIHIDVSHLAATPVGVNITASVNLTEVDDRRLVFEVAVRDDVELISRGTHQRFIINAEKFNRKVAKKRRTAAPE